MLDRVSVPSAGLREALAETAAAVDAQLARRQASPEDPSARLYEAMRYASIGGGKRLRPLLVSAAGALFDVPGPRLMRAGLAVECIHVHSLIHDDLPCMDDDDLRRGRPTVHLAFDEAVAVLAGDALMALGFELLAEPETHPSGSVRAELVAGLAQAAGAAGMAGGQMLDLNEGAGTGRDAIVRLQDLKTGALIGWSVGAGAVLGEAPAFARASLADYARCLGLAFQLADDLLDANGDENRAGKRLRKDAARGRPTLVDLLGEAAARGEAEQLAEQAVAHLDGFGPAAELLRDIAWFAIRRDH
jgi:farnesyl diphosphate synthase